MLIIYSAWLQNQDCQADQFHIAAEVNMDMAKLEELSIDSGTVLA